jgi:hypothetical protein
VQPAAALCRKPAGVTHEQAAALTMGGLTAWQALTRQAGLPTSRSGGSRTEARKAASRGSPRSRCMSGSYFRKVTPPSCWSRERSSQRNAASLSPRQAWTSAIW